MDSTAVQTGGALGIATFVLTILYKVYQTLNHKKVRIHCCSNVYEVGFDVDEQVVSPAEAASRESALQTPNRRSSSLQIKKLSVRRIRPDNEQVLQTKFTVPQLNETV